MAYRTFPIQSQLMPVDRIACFLFQLFFNSRKRTFMEPDFPVALRTYQIMSMAFSAGIAKYAVRRGFLVNQAVIGKALQISIYRRKSKVWKLFLQTLKQFFS